MAPDSGYKEFVLEGETAIQVDTSKTEDVDVGLAAVTSCVKSLLEARDQGTIVFADGVTGRMLETMAVLWMRAAHANDRVRHGMFQHWNAHGPDIVGKLITDATSRPGKMLMPDDFTAFMGTPPGH